MYEADSETTEDSSRGGRVLRKVGHDRLSSLYREPMVGFEKEHGGEEEQEGIVDLGAEYGEKKDGFEEGRDKFRVDALRNNGNISVNIAFTKTKKKLFLTSFSL